VRISRIRLSHWFHNRHYDKRDHLARANERSRCLGLTVELLLRDPVSNGVSGRKTNAPRLTLFRSAPNARAPSLHRRYPASSVLWARPTPTQARSLLGAVEGRDPSPTWVSRVATLSFSTCCPQYPGESLGNRTVAFFRAWQPSPRQRWVGTRGITFEACSRFTRVTARGFAGPPKEDFCPSGLTNPVTQDQPARSYRGDSVNSSGRTFTCKSAPPLHGARCLT
jgi:hypothetical protein